MATVMAVGIMGGDVEAAAFTAENATSYNCFLSVGNYADRRALEEHEQNAQTEEELALLAALIAQTSQHPLEQALETAHALASHPLPEGALRYINPINARTQGIIDRRERVFQAYDKVSPVLGVALRIHD